MFFFIFSPKLPDAEKYWYCSDCPIGQRWGQFKSVDEYLKYHSFENHARIRIHEDNETAPKGGLIWKGFSGWLQTSKKCAKNNPNIYPQEVKMLGIVFGIFLGEIGAKVKKKIRDYATFYTPVEKGDAEPSKDGSTLPPEAPIVVSEEPCTSRAAYPPKVPISIPVTNQEFLIAYDKLSKPKVHKTAGSTKSVTWDEIAELFTKLEIQIHPKPSDLVNSSLKVTTTIFKFRA